MPGGTGQHRVGRRRRAHHALLHRSGTRLAMADAAALAAVVNAHGDDVAAALRAYDATRRPVIDHVQQEARSSMRFLERAPECSTIPAWTGAVRLRGVQRLGNRTARWRYYMHLATRSRCCARCGASSPPPAGCAGCGSGPRAPRSWAARADWTGRG